MESHDMRHMAAKNRCFREGVRSVLTDFRGMSVIVDVAVLEVQAKVSPATSDMLRYFTACFGVPECGGGGAGPSTIDVEN